jgi:HK97 family phage prohead protease
MLNARAQRGEITVQQYLYDAGLAQPRTMPGGAVVDAYATKAWVTGTVDLDKRLVTIVASDETVDRYGDVIVASGWDVESYRRNPVVLLDHRYSVSSIVGTAAVKVESKQLKARITVDDPELNADAAVVMAKLRAGSLRAVSVGFIVGDTEYIRDKDDRITGVRILQSELLEISFVAVPANPSAVLSAAVHDEAAAHDTRCLARAVQLVASAR